MGDTEWVVLFAPHAHGVQWEHCANIEGAYSDILDKFIIRSKICLTMLNFFLKLWLPRLISDNIKIFTGGIGQCIISIQMVM